MLGIDAQGAVGSLEVEAEPLLNAQTAQAWGAGCQVHEEDEIKGEGSGKYGVAAEEIYLELHGVAEPAEDIDVVPTFFIITTRWVIIDANLVVNVLVEIG